MRLEAYAALIRFRRFLARFYRYEVQGYSEFNDYDDQRTTPLDELFFMANKYRNPHHVLNMRHWRRWEFDAPSHTLSRRTWRLNAAPKGKLP